MRTRHGNPLYIIGMGADGMDSLSVAAARMLFSADVIFTSRRLAELLPSTLREKVRTWAVPFDAMVDEIAGLRGNGQKVAVLATGNPFYYGVGSVLARHFAPEEIKAWPAPSAFALAAARLGWPQQDIWKISLHGRHPRVLEPFLVERSRVFVLTEPGSLKIVARQLKRRNLTGSRVVVLANLGAKDETIRELSVEEALSFDDSVLSLPHVIALDCQYEDERLGFHPLACSRAAGLPDDAFEHDGQITKAPVRAITVAALMPRPRTCLWDIGAGCGSVAIEWLRMSGHTAHAVAIERSEERCGMIARNADAVGAARLRIVNGTAPEALRDLPAPDVVFIGGGVADEAVFNAAWEALTPGGWLVANAVSLQAEQALLARHARLGGELMRIQVSHAAPLGAQAGAAEPGDGGMAEARADWGGYHAFRQSLPVTQWKVRKPA